MSFLSIGTIVLGAIIYQGVGMVWYSRFGFGPLWSKLRTISMHAPEDEQRLKKEMGIAYLGSFLGACILSGMLWVMLGLMGISEVYGGLLLGVMLWFGFTAPATFGGTLFDRKPLTLWLIDSGYQLIGIMAIAALHVLID